MAIPPLTEKQVYLALRESFSALPIPPSTAKKIRKKIEKHKDEAKIAPLIARYGVEGITAVAFALSGDQIFASTDKARTRFPDVFGDLTKSSRPSASASQTGTISAAAVQPTVTESNTAASSAAAVQRVGAVYSPQELMGIGDRLKATKEKEKNETGMLSQRIPQPS